MTMATELQEWLERRERPKAVICDIDETICTSFDHPIPSAIHTLQRFSRCVSVFYVTARPPSAGPATLNFLETNRLPLSHKVYFCEPWKSTLRHKTDTMARLASEYDILMSIGDADEDEEASRCAMIPFVRVDTMRPELSWQEAKLLLARHLPDNNGDNLSD